jgi:hypothetical protein
MENPPVTSDRLLRIGHAFRAAKTLLSAVELGVFTALAEGPADVEALRKRVGIDRRGARDFFDALVALGLLGRNEDGCYVNMSDTEFYLDRRKPTYIGGELEHFSTYVFPRWSHLTPALQTGEPQSGERATGHYSALYADRSALEKLVKGMTGGTLPVAQALAARFDWQKYNSIVDIGTAQGCLPVQLALAHPHLAGGGFDLPAV